MLCGSGDSLYLPNVVSNHQEVYQQIYQQVEFLPRSELPIKIYGKELLLPRDKAFFGDIGSDNTVPLFRYTGDYVPKLKDWCPVLRYLRDGLSSLGMQYCNHSVVNRYINGEDHIGFHADKIRDMTPGSSVFTLSFGTARELLLKHQATGETQKILLEPGSLFILGPKTNAEWKHSIPKRSVRTVPETRISVTLRSIKTRYNLITGEII